MSRPSTRRENRSARRLPSRQELTRILVVCGAQKTEPAYFEGLKRLRRLPSVHVDVENLRGDPDKVVARAHAKQTTGDFDQVWCVLDVDEFSFDRAVSAADHEGIRLAISNPCFEVWLLLHHVDATRAFSSAKDALKELGKHVAGYDKSRLRFDRDFAPGVDDAVRRGRSILPVGTGLDRNPSTGVWRLTETIVSQQDVRGSSS